jgi:prepilin-type N-terminal cleavage/methylation domain-containing protein
MKSNQQKKLNRSGFTLIEVVLVLAIGGLIFLLAFIAFQQVSANRRDTQRRSDALRMSAELANYSGDNNGAYPTTVSLYNTDFMASYMKNTNDPSTKIAYPDAAATLGTTPGSIEYTYYPSAVAATYFCDGTSLVTAKSFKIRMRLEKGITCADSN